MLPDWQSRSEASSKGFLDLESLVVPRRLADLAQQHMRSVGKKGHEGFALWIGRRVDETFFVDETLIPEQRGLCFADGVCVTVSGQELFRINQYLFASGRQLIAQLHSHPTDAYHSETDDTYPIATVAGAFSLVVPDFAARPFSLRECAVYRLVPGEGWIDFPATAVNRVIQLTDD